jgi:hypothetical protein
MTVADRRGRHDTLLWWCSEMGSGTLDEFVAACHELDLPRWEAARCLSALAHVEFSWRQSRWAVCEPVLTTVPMLPGRLLLCGGRPSGMLEKLSQSAAASGYDVIVDSDPIPQIGPGPATVFLTASARDAGAFAAASGLRFQPAAHRAIAKLLPMADTEVAAEPATPDPRFPHCLVDPDTLTERWDWEVPEGTEGLWAWQTWQRRSARYLREQGQWWYVPDRAWAPYLLPRPAGSDPLVRYEPAHRILIVDAAAPLPGLHARAATLCSGRTALREHLAEDVAEDHYVNVDDLTAERIIASLELRQERSQVGMVRSELGSGNLV